MSDWSETRSLLTELEQLFLRDNDVSDVLDVAKMAKEIEIHRESNLMSAKALIKGNVKPHYFPCTCHDFLIYIRAHCRRHK
jgi:hypothetical protein